MSHNEAEAPLSSTHLSGETADRATGPGRKQILTTPNIDQSPTQQAEKQAKELRLAEIMAMALNEWERQDRKHPDGKRNSHDTWTRVMVEELGEVAKLLDTKGINSRNRKKLKKELTQVVAVAARWLSQVMDEEETTPTRTWWPPWKLWQRPSR